MRNSGKRQGQKKVEVFDGLYEGECITISDEENLKLMKSCPTSSNKILKSRFEAIENLNTIFSFMYENHFQNISKEKSHVQAEQ